jgi:hypothetical protein
VDSLVPALVRDTLARLGALEHLIATGTRPYSQLAASRAGKILARKRRDLERVQADPDLGDPRFFPDHLRAYQQAIREVNVVEGAVGALFANPTVRDERLSDLGRRLWAEVGCRGEPPAITCTSGDYYFTHVPFHIVVVPVLETDFVLSVPDLVHEFGHLLLATVPNALDGIVHETVHPVFIRLVIDLESRRAPDGQIDRARLGHAQWASQWLEEAACDAVAAYALGPIFAWQHMRLSSAGDAPFGADSVVPFSHPSDDARMQLLVELLRRMGVSAELEELTTAWQRFTDTLQAAAHPYRQLFDPPELFPALADALLSEVAAWGVRDFRTAPTLGVVETLAEAWHRFRTNADDFRIWEREVVDRLPSGGL